MNIILGTVQFGLDYGILGRGLPSEDDCKQMMSFAHENHIRTLDSAIAYGLAHERIASFHLKSSSKFNIITKFHSSDINGSLRSFLVDLCSELNVTRLSCLMFHSFTDYELNRSIAVDLVELGDLVERVGVSVYGLDEALVVEGDPCIQVIQMPFNLFYLGRREDDFLSSKNRRCDLHIRSVYAQGLVFAGSNSQIKKLPVQLQEAVFKIQEVCNTYSMNIGALALHVVRARLSDRDAMLVAADGLDQLKETVRILNEESSDPPLELITEIVSSVPVLDLDPRSWP
ncbi:MAG: hypothetical protein CME71_12695 [Halobacteriovorax sp.]|nr:hypothetical protein [Halobacteriovorax sp.]